MPTESVIVSALVLAAFGIFGITLLASSLLDWRANRRRIHPAE